MDIVNRIRDQSDVVRQDAWNAVPHARSYWTRICAVSRHSRAVFRFQFSVYNSPEEQYRVASMQVAGLYFG